MEYIARKQARVSVVWKATLVRLNGEHLSGSTDNVSTAGLNVIVAKELVIGEPVQIEIVTPCRTGVHFFRLDGVVVYQKELGQNLGNAVGFKLLQPGDDYAEFVQALERRAGLESVGNGESVAGAA